MHGSSSAAADHIRGLVARGELLAAAVAIREAFTSSGDAVDEATLQMSRISELDRRENLGLAPPPEIAAGRQLIAAGILGLVKRLEQRSTLGAPPRILQPDSQRATILFLASNPTESTRLALDVEARSIAAGIREARYRDSCDFRTAWAVRPDDLLRELNEYRPTVVHFSGHGSRAGELLLMNEDGRLQAVSGHALTAVFATLRNDIRLVVLNACFSRTQADAIRHVIDCVVGMDDEIGDAAAITFAGAFYRALAYGCSVQQAFEQGLASLELEGIPEGSVPKLLTRDGIAASDIFVAGPGP